MVISIYLFKSSTEARAYQGHSVLYEGVTCPLFSQTIKLQSTACLWADRPFHKSGWRSFPFPENWIMFPNMWCVPNGDILDRVWTGSHGPHSITDLESVSLLPVQEFQFYCSSVSGSLWEVHVTVLSPWRPGRSE